MPPLTLDGDTLGEKHKHFNKLVQDAVNTKEFNLTKLNSEDSDISNLLKIDTACKTKNVPYIIEVLKCDDLLYVSRAIKHSTWLITEQQHAHIINPQYLYTELFPHMLTKAINKFLLHIRLHLKDEKRVETFYDYLKDDPKEAQKWLPACSIDFVENSLKNTHQISLKLYTRLIKRSIFFLQYYTKVEGNSWTVLKIITFLIRSNTEECLDFLDAREECYFPRLGKTPTKMIMKKCPHRILDNFDKYMELVDISTVAKYMKKEEIKPFLYRQEKISKKSYFFSNYSNLEPFIKSMPKEERFDFVKKTFIDKDVLAPTVIDNQMSTEDGTGCLRSCSVKSYEWYKYAPFNEALKELKQLIRAENSPADRCAMLLVLSSCARRQPQHIKTLLQYYYDKHRNEPFKFKIRFVNNIITQIPPHHLDSETWFILDNLFRSLEVYTESDKNVQICLNYIILYNVLNDKDVPDIVEKKNIFDTFKKHQNQLNEEEQNKLFSYLLRSISTKIQNKTITSESDFNDTVELLENALNLFIDWKKHVQSECDFIHNKIRELLKIKKENTWDIQLSPLYNLNKSCRRHMFEDSILLCPSEEVCLNALKHRPLLLTPHKDQLDALTTDEFSLQRVLAKLRVYWPHSLAQQWVEAYYNNINKTTGHKALVKGLFVLLPQKQVMDVAIKYTPEDFKIEWSNVDQAEHRLQKNIAGSLYVARPLIPFDTVLSYAKGDYLQYTVPSINSLLHNMNSAQSRDHMSKLLEAPVSLQKYGLQLAFYKLKSEEIKPIFMNIWKTTKNLTIRYHLFVHTYNLLCKAKETSTAIELMELLSMFIDNLTENENISIYRKLGNAAKVHESVRGEFFMKGYKFLASLPAKTNCEDFKNKLIEYAPNIMNLLDSDFVADKMLAPVVGNIFKSRSSFTGVMLSYVLHGKTEAEQCERFEKVLVPALEHAIKFWNVIKNDEFVVKENIDQLLKGLTWDFRRFSLAQKIIVPVKLFSKIEAFIKQKMSMKENYILYTSWKLTTEYVKIVDEHKDMLRDSKLDQLTEMDFKNSWLPDTAENVWEQMHMKISPKFGPIIVKHLKEDTQNYFPTICWLFSDALQRMLQNLSLPVLSEMTIMKYMIMDEDFIPSYIVVCECIPKYGDDESRKQRLEIRKILEAHPSTEVQMHYRRTLNYIVDTKS